VNIQPAGTSGLEENGLFSQVYVYPNPFNNELVIDLSSLKGENVGVEVIDITGKVLISSESEMQSMVNFDMSSFAKGVYQVRLTYGSERTIRRVIKM
jgi:hypothetical protein